MSQPTMHDGDEEYNLPGIQNPDPPKFGKKRDVNDEIAGLVHDVRGTVQASQAAPVLEAILGRKGGEDPGINAQMVTMVNALSTTLTGLVSAEREARQRAEAATTQIQQQYFTSQAEYIKQLYEKASNPPALPQNKSEFDNFKQWQQIINEAATQLESKHPPGPVVQTGISQLDLELKKMDLENARIMVQMQQAHELAMKDIDLKMANFHLEVAKFKRGEDSKSGWLDEVLGVLGVAVAQGSKTNGGLPGGGMGQQVPTPGGLMSSECSNCRTKMTYPPGSEFFSCGKCGAQYTTKEAPVPPAAPPESPAFGQTFEEDDFQRGG